MTAKIIRLDTKPNRLRSIRRAKRIRQICEEAKLCCYLVMREDDGIPIRFKVRNNTTSIYYTDICDFKIRLDIVYLPGNRALELIAGSGSDIEI